MLAFSAFLRRSIPWSVLRSWLAYAALPLAGLATAPMMARALGPTGRGELASILQPLTVAGAFASIGIPAAITFFIGRGHSVQKTQRAARPIVLVAALTVYGALLLYAPEISRIAHVPFFFVAIAWLSVIPGALLSGRRAAWQGLRQFSPIDLERATAGAARFGLIAVLFLLGVTASAPYVIVYVLAGLIASIFLFRKLPLRPPVFERPRKVGPSNILRYSLLASIGTIMATLNNRLDQAVLPSAIGARELGLYSIAVTVAEVPFIVSTVTARNLLAEASHRSPKGVLLKTYCLGLSGVVLASASLAVIAPYIVPIVFGEPFRPAVPIIWLLLGATVLGSVTEGINAVVAGRGRPGLASVSSAAGAATSIGLLTLFWHGMSMQAAGQVAIAAQLVAAATGIVVLRYVSRAQIQGARPAEISGLKTKTQA